MKAELAKADWVSFKIDSKSEKIWRRINRPHRTLKPEAIWAGMLEFADSYSGTLVTETMLVKGINDNVESFTKIAKFLNHMQPVKAYVAVPIRPPAEKWVRPPDGNVINEAFQILNEKPFQVEYLIGYEGNAFAYSGDVEQDILNITAVHPMRKEALNALLSRANAKWTLIDRLLARGDLKVTEYDNHQFFLRRIKR